MAELFQITKTEKATLIREFPFQDELNDLEPFVKENPQVLGESIEVFAEQVDTGISEKIDLLALDRIAGGAQIALIELKAGLAPLQTLLQTLRYANWIKNNPDSIKLLLEKKRLPTDNVGFTPKIIIAAPQIDPALVELSQYTSAFEFDFIELRRFGTKDNCYLVADHKTLQQLPITRALPQGEWDWEKYKTKLGISEDQIEIGKSLFDKIVAICQENQWSLTPRFNKLYITFKFGARNVILINYWLSSQLCHLGFKLGQAPQQLSLTDPYPNADHKFLSDLGEYYVRIEQPGLEISGYIPFMEAAYRNVTKG
jgi:hypothetical protein